MGKDLKGKELGVGISQEKTDYILHVLSTGSAKDSISVLRNCRNADSG